MPVDLCVQLCCLLRSAATHSAVQLSAFTILLCCVSFEWAMERERAVCRRLTDGCPQQQSGVQSLARLRPPQVEDPKKVLLLYGNKTSQVVKDVLADIGKLKAVRLLMRVLRSCPSHSSNPTLSSGTAARTMGVRSTRLVHGAVQTGAAEKHKLGVAMAQDFCSHGRAFTA